MPWPVLRCFSPLSFLQNLWNSLGGTLQTEPCLPVGAAASCLAAESRVRMHKPGLKAAPLLGWDCQRLVLTVETVLCLQRHGLPFVHNRFHTLASSCFALIQALGICIAYYIGHMCSMFPQSLQASSRLQGVGAILQACDYCELMHSRARIVRRVYIPTIVA